VERHVEITGYQLIIISDLHLSEGWNPETKRLSRNEDFFFDLNFQRFLQHLSKRAERGGYRFKLVINGDFVDFLQFIRTPDGDSIDGEPITKREKVIGFGTTTIKTLWKLKVLMNGHWIFFSALKEFISRGNEVIIIPGNHDIEWTIPEVQSRFIEKLSEDVSEEKKAAFRSRIRFVPWFYFDHNLSVFVEHGSQYDELNSFDHFLCPYRRDGTMDLPAGSFFVRYLFNRVECYYPFADNMKPMSKFIWWALRQTKTWFSYPPRIIEFLRFFRDTIAKAGPVDKDWEGELQKRHAQALRDLSNASGLRVQQIDELKKLWVPSAIHHCCRSALPGRFLSNSKLDSSYYLEKAKAVREIVGARYVVFGHTHEADIRNFPEGTNKKICEYVNSGTWTKSFAANYEEALLKCENEFVYVHLRYHEEKKDVVMELLRWNDSIKDGERVRLFEEEEQYRENQKKSKAITKKALISGE
jgi:UDP-2,3-diacylglucosamine pyrophosphatase LpxH